MEYLYDNDTDSFVKVMSLEEEFYKIVEEAYGGFEAYEKALAEEPIIEDDDDVRLPW